MNKPEPPDNLWDELAKAESGCLPRFERPVGTFTIPEFASRRKLGYDQARRRVLALLRAGKVEAVDGYQTVKGGKYYRLVKR